MSNYTPQVGNQAKQNNNMLVGNKTMMMKDPNFVTDGRNEEMLSLKEEVAVLRKEFLTDERYKEMLSLREEVAVLRKEFDKLIPPQMVRDEMKLAEVKEELDLLKRLKSEVATLAGKVKELEKYLQGGVKFGVPGLEKSASDEVNTSLEANKGGIRSEKEKEGPNCEVMEEVKAQSTRPVEGTKEVAVESEVNNNMDDDTAKSSTASDISDDTKKVKKAGVAASGESSVLLAKRLEEVKAEKSINSTRPVDQQVEKTGVHAPVKTSLPIEEPVLDFVSVKPKMVKKRSK